MEDIDIFTGDMILPPLGVGAMANQHDDDDAPVKTFEHRFFRPLRDISSRKWRVGKD